MTNFNTRAKNLCKHEVGHYLASREFGFRTGNVKISVYQDQNIHLSRPPQSGGCIVHLWTPHIDNISKITEYLENRIVILYSGAISEAMNDNGKYDSEYAHDEWKLGGAKEDFSKIRELIQLLRSIKFPETNKKEKIQDELDEIAGSLMEKSQNIIQKNLNLLMQISNKMANDVKEHGEEYSFNLNNFSEVIEVYGIQSES